MNTSLVCRMISHQIRRSHPLTCVTHNIEGVLGKIKSPNVFINRFNMSTGSDRRKYKRSNNKRRTGRILMYTLFPIISVGTALSGYMVYRKIQTNHAAKLKKKNQVSDEDSQFSSERQPVAKDDEEEIKEKPVKRRSHRSKKEKHLDLEAAITVSRDLCLRIKDEAGSPGLSVAVFNGREMWSDGFGYADLENRVRCHGDSVMRIASISKSIAMTIVAKLCEESKLDLDAPIQEYISEWPEKTFQGEKVHITTRQLVSHLSGVRHYDKGCGRKKKDKNKGEDSSKDALNVPDTVYKEFYSKEEFDSVFAALEVFKNDELCSKPGTTYLYTTHGWTVVSAVAEMAAEKKFSLLLQQLFRDIGMENTYLDEGKPLIYNRARQYMKNKQGRIINAPYVDCSNKWAGGGIVSTARDVAKFGNAMLYSQQYEPTSGLPPGYLAPKTMDLMWTPVDKTKCAWDKDGKYGMGWAVVTPSRQWRGHCKEVREYYSHTGGAVGGASVLVVLPNKGVSHNNSANIPPRGVSVAMIANMSSVGLSKTAMKIAKIFETLDDM